MSLTNEQSRTLEQHPCLTKAEFESLSSVSREAMASSLRLVLEDGSLSPLRDNYVVRIQETLQRRVRDDFNWLSVDERGVLFHTRSGACLPVCCLETMHVVVDQSGSMSGVQDAVFAGAREVVQSVPDAQMVSFTTFASNVRIGDRNSKQAVLDDLSSTPIAHGSTCLYDAIVCVVHEERDSVRSTIVIVTDGFDTCSTHSHRDAKEACTRFQSEGRRILFLGSNQDAILSADGFGIPASRALSMGSDPSHMQNAMRSVSSYVGRGRGSDGFTDLERRESIA